MWPFKKKVYKEFRESFFTDETARFRGSRGNGTNLDFSNLRISSIGSNVFYENVSFFRVHFNNFALSKVCFYNCTFTLCTFDEIETDVLSQYLETSYNVVFEKCIFSYFNFLNCSITYSVFSKCKFNVGTFKSIEFRDVVFHMCSFSCVRFIEGGVLQHTGFLSPSGFFDIRFERSNKQYLIDSASGVSRFDYKDNQHIDSLQKKRIFRRIAFTDVAATFYSFKQIFEENHIKKSSVDHFYLYKKADTRSAYKLPIRIAGYFAECVFGYGTSPFRALLSLVLVSVLYAPVYMVTGFSMGGRTINYSFDLSQLFVWNTAKVKDLLECLYYSFFTLCTVGRGSGIPISGLTKLFSSSELFIGAILVTVFISTLFKKITD